MVDHSTEQLQIWESSLLSCPWLLGFFYYAPKLKYNHGDDVYLVHIYFTLLLYSLEKRYDWGCLHHIYIRFHISLMARS